MTASSVGEALEERDSELAVLGRALDEAVAGRGGIVLVEGAAGIGKTRLLDEVCRTAAGRARVLRGRGGELERDLPLAVARELFAPLVRQLDDAARARVFAGAAAAAGPLLGLDTDVPGAEPPASGFALVHALYWLTANLADESPVLLAVDDVHWLDEPTGDWLGYLVPRVAELPVLLVMCARPKVLDPASPLAHGLARQPVLTSVRPIALSAVAGAALVRRRLPRASDAFCAACHDATAGNPLLLRTLVNAVVEAGLAPTDDGARRLHDLGSIGIERVVLPRLHRLGQPSVDLARALAVLGDTASAAVAADVAGIDRPRAAEALDRLVAADIVVAGSDADGPVGFTHPLVRSVVAGELLPGHRGSLHQAAARTLRDRGADAERVARHLVATDPVDEGWVVPLLTRAAALARVRGTPEAALRYVVAALGASLEPAERGDLLVHAAMLAFKLRDPRAPEWFVEALPLTRDPDQWFMAWMGAVNWHTFNGWPDPEPGLWLDTMPPDTGPDIRYAARARLVIDDLTGGNRGRGRAALGLPEPSTTPRGDTAYGRMWLTAAAIEEVLRAGDRHRAHDLAVAACSDILEPEHDRPPFGWLPTWAMVSLVATGDLEQAERAFTTVRDQAVRNVTPVALEWVPAKVAWTQLRQGEVARAAATMASVPADPAEFRTPGNFGLVSAVAAAVLAARGRPQDALAVLGRWGMSDDEAVGDTVGSAIALEMRATVRERAGDLSGALATHERCGKVLRGLGWERTPLSCWRSGAARLLARTDRAEEARDLATAQVADARAWGATPLLGGALAALGTVVGGAEGESLLEEAVELLDGSSARGELAQALLDLGRLRRRDRRRSDAREVLERAADLAERTGAVGLADQVEEELRLCGARPRRRAVSGVHALTPAELRVATLAAEGRSNPEIAQSLFVTRKTVEKHLGSVFAKLHVTSRDQLPVVLRAQLSGP